MPFYLVRHGETSLSGTFCGSSNPGLTARGRDQGRSASRILSRFPIDIGYFSPLLRTRQTAQILRLRLNVPLVSRLSLREISFGAWEGLRFEDIEEKWPRLAKLWARDPMKVRIPRAESFPSLRSRIKRFLATIKKENVLVVAHGGTLSAVGLELLGLPNTEFPNYVPPIGSVRVIQDRKMRALC